MYPLHDNIILGGMIVGTKSENRNPGSGSYPHTYREIFQIHAGEDVFLGKKDGR